MNITLTSTANLGPNITVFALTGGPCSGKTTALAKLTAALKDKGYKVLVVPEAATKLINGGFCPWEVSRTLFQERLFLDVLAQEEHFLVAAQAYRDRGEKVVVLCDRGAMDGQAYVEVAEFEQMVASHGLTLHDVCEHRYHAVIHMRTAALGAEEFYTLENNTARTETPEQARTQDEKTLQAWQRHHHPRIIDNSTTFEQKIARVLVEVCAVLGDPEPIEREQKFLIEKIDVSEIPVHCTVSTITQDYLVSDDANEEHRVRARQDDHGVSYSYTIKRPHGNGSRFETERMIGRREYESLLALKDPRFQTIRKTRLCFFHESQFIEIDLFHGSLGPDGLAVMEIEQSREQETTILPPFVIVVANVTGNNKYSNRSFARIAT